nr:MAG TPA: hypothetical protein [Caudoviricetes sp.]
MWFWHVFINLLKIHCVFRSFSLVSLSFWYI